MNRWKGHVGGSYAAADCEDSGCSIHGGGGGGGDGGKADALSSHSRRPRMTRVEVATYVCMPGEAASASLKSQPVPFTLLWECPPPRSS